MIYSIVQTVNYIPDCSNEIILNVRRIIAFKCEVELTEYDDEANFIANQMCSVIVIGNCRILMQI